MLTGMRGPRGAVEEDCALGHAQRRYKYRGDKVCGAIVHTTGAGPWRRWQQNPQRWASPWDAARHIYRAVMKESPHFVICGETGHVVQMVPMGFAAWHTGSRGAWRYKRKALQHLPKWWRERWPELKGPADLLDGRLWRGGSANELCVGVEVTPPFDHPRGPWTPAAWTSLAWLLQYLAGEHGFPFDPYHVFTHSDAHPRQRTTDSGRPWDPGTNQWSGRDAVLQMAAIRLPRHGVSWNPGV